VRSKLETDSFIQLIQDYKGVIYKILYSFCKDAEERKDLQQEILIQLWRSFKNNSEKATLAGWVYRVALNVAISHYRKEVKRKVSRASLDEIIYDIHNDNYLNQLNPHLNELYLFIHRLDPFNKALIMLYLEEKSYKEIEEILGISETNVGTKINRIKKELKDQAIKN
jgi:RNA polymerase sigma factor (sigma-70 family)